MPAVGAPPKQRHHSTQKRCRRSTAGRQAGRQTGRQAGRHARTQAGRQAESGMFVCLVGPDSAMLDAAYQRWTTQEIGDRRQGTACRQQEG